MRNVINKYGLWVFIGCVLVAIVVLDTLPTPVAEDNATEPRLLTASTIDITPQTRPIELVLTSQMYPVNQSVIRSLVDGQVSWINPAFRNGAQLNKGEVALRIDSTELQAQMQAAKLQLAQAELQLLSQQREAERAIANWRRIHNTKPKDALISRDAQLRLAEQEVATAKALMKQAQLQLGYAEVRAPFAGEIFARAVAEGEWLTSGQALANIISSDALELNLQLSETQWSSLFDVAPVTENSEKEGSIADDAIQAWVLDDDNQPVSPLLLSRVANSLTDATQLRSMYFRYHSNTDSQDQPLAGEWVKVCIQGRAREGLWPLPHSSITRDGGVWWVDDDTRLQKSSIKRVFMTDDVVYVYLPNMTRRSLKVIEYPQSYFVVGRRLQAKGDAAQ